MREDEVQKVVCRKVSQLRGTGFPSRATGQSRLALAARAVSGARIPLRLWASLFRSFTNSPNCDRSH